MNIILSSTVLASVLAPAFSFSYLDQLGGGNPVAYSAPAAAATNGASYLDALGGSAPAVAVHVAHDAPAAPAAPAAAAAPYVPAPSGAVEPSAGGNYFDSLNTGESVHGTGVRTHLDTLNSNAPSLGGAGIHTYTENLATASAIAGGVGIHTYTDGYLGGGSVAGGDFSPFGSKASSTPSFAPFAGTTSADGVAFTLETGDISGLVQDLSGGGTIRLTGSINDISYN